MSGKPIAHEQTLAEYLGQASVVGMPPNHGAGAYERLKERRDEFSSWDRIDIPERPDLELRRKGIYANVVLDAVTGDLLGGYTFSGPYTDPAHRGRGICSEIHYSLDIIGQRTDAACYTMAGMMTRVATHRLHVERALRRGLDVPERVLADYHIDPDGKARLREPMTAERHNASAKALRRAQAQAIIDEETVDYTAAFRSADDINHPDFICFAPHRDGYALAIGLMREYGAEIRATVINGRAYVQAMINQDLVDSHGIRHEELCVDDLWRRGSFSTGMFGDKPPAPPEFDEMRIFEDESALLDWLRPGDPFGMATRATEFSEDLVAEAMESRPGQAARQALEDILDQKYEAMTA